MFQRRRPTDDYLAQVVAGGPEAVLVGHPVDRVRHAVSADVAVVASHHSAVLVADQPLLALDVHRLAVRLLVAVGEGAVRVLEVVRADELHRRRRRRLGQTGGDGHQGSQQQLSEGNGAGQGTVVLEGRDVPAHSIGRHGYRGWLTRTRARQTSYIGQEK